jgi:hypothetical protein
MNMSVRKSLCLGLSIACVSTGWAVVGCSSSDKGGTSSPEGGTSETGGSKGSGGSSSNSGGSAGRATGGRGGNAGSTGGAPDASVGGAGGAPADGGADVDAGPPGMVRVVHAAAGASSVDLYTKGSSTPIAKALAYGKSTDYLNLTPGAYELEVRTAGAAASSDPIYTTPVIDVVSGKKITAIAAGTVGSTDAKDSFRVLPLEESFTAATAGTTRVRVVHAAADAPTVGVDVNNDNPTAPEIATLDRFADTGAAGIELPSNNALVQIGVDAAGARVTAFTMPKLPDGEDVFVIAAGRLGKLARETDGFSLIAVMADSTTALIQQNPRVYGLLASTDAGAVDVYTGNIEVLDNVAFGSLNSFQVPPQAFTLDFFAGTAGLNPRPSTPPLATAILPTLLAGQQYLAVGAGQLKTAPTTFQMFTVPEGFELADTTKARLRVLHASIGEPAVDVGTVTVAGTLVTPPLLATNLTFGQVSPLGGVSSPVGDVRIGLAATGTTPTLAEFGVTTTNGERAFVVVAGDAANATYPLQLIVVDTSVSPWKKTLVPKL